jgi:hypothetical protein
MTTKKMEAGLADALERDPDASYDLLLRVDRVDDQRQAEIEAAGAIVRRRLTLTPLFAVTCSGACAAGLAERTWVQRVESDGLVYAL